MTIPSPTGRPAAELLAADDSQREQRDRIIERAIVMFNQMGYDRVRVIDITDSLNIGKGTFYLYFSDKKDLLLRCFDRVGALILELESLPAIREGDFFAKVGPRVQNIGQRKWFPGLVNLLRAAESSPDAEIKMKAREAYDCIAENLRRDFEMAVKEGHARDAAPDLVAYGFIGLAENLWFRSRLDRRYSPEQIVTFMVEETRRWLSAEPPAPGASKPAERTVVLVCRDRTQLRLANVRFDGGGTIPASLGHVQIDLVPARLTSLILDEAAEAGEERPAHLVAGDGSEFDVVVNGSVGVSGDTAVGAVRVAMRDLAGLTWDAQSG